MQARQIALVFTALLVLPAGASAASFDCAKATTPVERLVCSDPALSQLDEALALAYATATASHEQAELVRSQRRWLAQRNACGDRACIKAAYEARLQALALSPGGANCDPEKGVVDTDRCVKRSAARKPDPFDDNKLTCAEMKRYPDRIFDIERGIDLGSGSGSPIEVDYSCKEGLASLPFLQKLKSLSEEIRSDNGTSTCTGSIIHAQRRYYHFDLLMAGFAPHKLLAAQAAMEKASNLYPQGRDENLFGYFERWSYEGIYNFQLHQVYMAELAQATALLARHYENTFGHPRAKAQTLARLGTKLFVVRAAGTFPKDSMPETERILESARHMKGSIEALKSGLNGMYIDYIRMGLNIALLTQRPVTHISLLAEGAESLNYGGESPLFFALGNPSNVRFLLERGANVNYQNGFGKTPLFYAIGFNDQAMTELLLDKGAQINHRYLSDPKKDQFDCTYNIEHTARTPLMHAAQHADVSMLKLLLRRGAKLEEVDGVGHNAAAYALLNNRQENAAHLKSIGLTSPQVERQLSLQRKYSECFEAAATKKLKDKALQDFYSSCLRP